MERHDENAQECKCIVCDSRHALMGVLVKHGHAIEVKKPDGTSRCRVTNPSLFFETLAIVCAEALSQAEPANNGVSENFYEAIEGYMAELRSEDDATVHLMPPETEEDEIIDDLVSATKH